MKRLILPIIALFATGLGCRAQEKLITRASQLSSPYTDSQEGRLSNLLDGNLNTFWHSDWHRGRMMQHSHYFQVELDKPIKGYVTATIGRRRGAMIIYNHPTLISVEASTDGNDYVNVGQLEIPYDSNVPLLSATFHLNKKTKFLRFYCDRTNGNLQEGFWHMSEFQLSQGSVKPKAAPKAKTITKVPVAPTANLVANNGTNYTYGRNNQPKKAESSHLHRILSDFSVECLTANESEKGRDRLDSLYYLNTKIYVLPYVKTEEKKNVNKLIQNIIAAYDIDLTTATGGFSHTSPLSFGPTVESKKLSMYYAEEVEPFIVGGKGRNYVVVRQQDPHNINYRTCEGVEWWLEVPGVNELILDDRAYDVRDKKRARVRFRIFNLYGPLTEKHYEKAFNEHIKASGKGTGNGMSSLTEVGYASRNNPINHDEFILHIQILAAFYRDTDSPTDDAVVRSINERLSDYLIKYNFADNSSPTDKLLQLFRTLGKISGYQAVVYNSTDHTFEQEAHGDFEWLANHYPHGKKIEVNWYTKGDAKCQGNSRNFLLEIHVEE